MGPEPNFKLIGKAYYVFKMIQVMTYYKRTEETFWWQAHLEDRLREGRN